MRVIALLLAMTIAAWPAGPAMAQTPSDKSYRLAVLGVSEWSLRNTRDMTLPALAAKAFVEGRNLVVDSQSASPADMPDLARRMIASKPQVIVAIGGDALRAARAATGLVPIVSFGPDRVALGVGHSLARPGGHVTGIVILGAELDAKRLHLLHEAMPELRRIAGLGRTEAPGYETSMTEMRAVATAAGFELALVDAAGPGGYEAAFATLSQHRMQALVIAADPILFRDVAPLMALANAARLPAACQWREMAEAGCLLAYGPNLRTLRARLADYVAKILRGANPGDLPIEQPTTFELAVNLKAAKALGLTIAESFLVRADEVIE